MFLRERPPLAQLLPGEKVRRGIPTSVADAGKLEGPNLRTPATAPTAPGHGPTGLESSNV